MTQIDKNQVERFFNNSCTADEAREVLKWFNTPEGQKYLEKEIEKDVGQIEGPQLELNTPDFDASKVFREIKRSIDVNDGKKKVGYSKDYWKIGLRVAATVLVIITASIFTYSTHQLSVDTIQNPTAIQYATTADELKEVELIDGTKVQINSNSEMIVNEDFLDSERVVELNGEAFFEVAHLPDKPFRVIVDGAYVEVLGTAFNIKLETERNREVQLAVVEGSVSFGGFLEESRQNSLVLEAGQFGYMDLDKREINVEEFGVQNYLMWMNGRVLFDDLTLEQVCTQLNRIYNLSCHFNEEYLKDMRITAEFQWESVDKTLSVISVSLEIDYELDGDGNIIWI